MSLLRQAMYKNLLAKQILKFVFHCILPMFQHNGDVSPESGKAALLAFIYNMRF
jgi:hypothetical protein